MFSRLELTAHADVKATSDTYAYPAVGFVQATKGFGNLAKWRSGESVNNSRVSVSSRHISL